MKRKAPSAAEPVRAPHAGRERSRGDALQPALRMQDALGNRRTGALLEHLRGTGGEPLEPRVRLFMEASYGERFDAVRVHRGGDVDAAARSLGASAFAHGADLYFRSDRYAPRTPAGLRLLGHELAHVIQQGGARATPPAAGFAAQVRESPRLEQEADAAAGALFGDGAVPAPSVSAGAVAPAVQCSPESELISANTSWGNLDEEALGKILLKRALLSEHDFVQRVIDQLGSTDRDDVSLEFVKAASDQELAKLRAGESGRRLLDRLYDELTAGKPDAEELQQAERVLKQKAQKMQWGDVEKGVLNAKIFPYRLPGLTVFSDAPISARRRPKERVWVKMPVRVLGTSEFREETKTLPTDVFSRGLELPEDEIIGVKMYDLGGEIHYRPALYLVQLANETTTTTFEKIGEAAGYGLALATGGASAGAGRLAQVLLWADRVALGVGVITSILREHRGWIISKFGDDGREFLHYVDIVNGVVAFYGGVRALAGMAQLLTGLAKSASRWRSSVAAAKDLSDSERKVVDAATKHIDDVENDVAQIQKLNATEAGQVASTEGAAAKTAQAGVPAPQPKAPLPAPKEPPPTAGVAPKEPPVATPAPKKPPVAAPAPKEPPVAAPAPKEPPAAAAPKEPVAPAKPVEPAPAEAAAPKVAAPEAAPAVPNPAQQRIDAASAAVAKAEEDLEAAKALAAEPGAGAKAGKALVKESEKALEEARQALRDAERIAKREKLGRDVAELDRKIKDILYKKKPSPPGAPRRSPGEEPAMASEEGKELYRLRGEKKEAVGRMRGLEEDWVGTLRKRTPGPGADERALANMKEVAPELQTGPIDVTSPTGAPIAGAVSPDHIYPVSKIVKLPGFEDLTPAQQMQVLEMTENYFPLSRSAQFSKKDLTMAEWFKTPIGSQVPLKLRPTLLDAERKAEAAVRAAIEQLLKGKK